MFIPFTGKKWDKREPIRYVLRESVEPNELQERDEVHPLHFGPAAILRHALPGEVRTDWQRRGFTLSPSLIVLDENLSREHETAWIVCFFGIVCGIVFLAMALYIPRVLRAAAPKRPTGTL